jgi:hypothetical protein
MMDVMHRRYFSFSGGKRKIATPSNRLETACAVGLACYYA